MGCETSINTLPTMWVARGRSRFENCSKCLAVIIRLLSSLLLAHLKAFRSQDAAILARQDNNNRQKTGIYLIADIFNKWSPSREQFGQFCSSEPKRDIPGNRLLFEKFSFET